jgi:hypothetical protein
VTLDDLAPLIRHAVRACQRDIYRHMSATDYCDTCPLLELCAGDEKARLAAQPKGEGRD